MVVIVNYVCLCDEIMPSKFGGQVRDIAHVWSCGVGVACAAPARADDHIITIKPDNRNEAIGRIWPPNLEGILPLHRRT